MIQDINKANESITENSYEISKLKEILPQCFNKDGAFNMETFKSVLKDNVAISDENYELNFLGKSYARLIAALDTDTVIVPDEEHNNKPENKNSNNVYISGDNLDALKHLLKAYEGKIKCIYIDPPYNTGSDGFVYNDKFNFTVDYLVSKLGIDEDEANRILNLTKKNNASHSAWMTFMYPRLLLARDLLANDGVIFISIDDNEQSNLKLLCDSIFGERRFVALFPWRKRSAKSDVPFGVSQDYEWILCYSKSENFKASIEGNSRKYYNSPDFPDRMWRIHDLTKQTTADERPNSYFDIINPRNGVSYPANPNSTWRVTVDTIDDYIANNRIIFPGDYSFLRISKPVMRYWKDEDIEKDGKDFGRVSVSTKLSDEVGMYKDGTADLGNFFDEKIFTFPKPVSLIKFLIKIINDDNAIILDFFSGSATTAQAIMQINAENSEYGNRKYIMVQLPEAVKDGSVAQRLGFNSIDEIGMERIKRAARKIKEKYSDVKIDLGFKHFTLKNIDNTKITELEEFDPELAITSSDDILNSFGVLTVLTTWLVKDSYEINAAVEKIKLADYTAYRCGKHLYLLNMDFGESELKALIEKYDADNSFSVDTIVLFGYSFTWSQKTMLEDNLKKFERTGRNIKVNVITRY